ncbi:MAG: segregation/condensation protein A [Candidatus Moranbacteria bacterium]|nr:segregation/condensation protein A [Candidatus Moranbacteria bacterium]
MPCHIRISLFEGPLELLLALIEDRKLDVTRVSLADVADQYLAFLSAERDRIDIANLASFLVIASRLILIKSKMLLPILEFTDEEEEAIEDLEIRLAEYRRFREAAQGLARFFERRLRSYPREKFLGAPEVFAPPKGITPAVLHRHFETILGEIPTKEKIVEETIDEVMSLEERIVTLQESLRVRAETSFRELAAAAENQMEVIVSFLAVLELVKQRFVIADQGDAFGEIRISVSERESAVFF